jgi:hypothetical protein
MTSMAQNSRAYATVRDRFPQHAVAQEEMYISDRKHNVLTIMMNTGHAGPVFRIYRNLNRTVGGTVGQGPLPSSQGVYKSEAWCQ